jgi:hypothetical protein
MMASLLGLSLSFTPKKKQRNDNEPPGLPSSTNLKKNKEMTMS